MEYRQLGTTDINVSAICLGTMTWGEQNSELEAHEQLDYALAHGINFIDTAEMYPVPPKAETYSRTESYIGSWLAKRSDRDRIVLATKIAGPGNGMEYLRGGQTRFTREHIYQAVDASLKRLQTDYIDLYQLHWPERQTNFFGRLGYQPPRTDALPTPFEETLEAMEALVQAGKIRHFGLSNETAWGVMKYLSIADRMGLPRPVSVQNPYNLLNRSYEIGLAEVSHRERAGLLAYSPLAFGVLTGKYAGASNPPNARLTLFERFTRYNAPEGRQAAEEYVHVAREHGLDPAQMALAFVTSRAFVTSNIIGATSMEQLKTNIDSASVTLSEEVFKSIERIHRRLPNPCP